MRLLFVALNFHPDRLGNAPIITDLAAGLQQRGHAVTVLCALPHHETGRIAPEYRGRLWQRERVRGVDVLRVWIATGEGGLLKLANYASFTAIAALAGSLLPAPDLIFSPSPPITLGLVDGWLARLKGTPFVFNLQDLFPDVAIQLGVLRDRRAVALFRGIEELTYRRAAHLTVLSAGMAELLARRGVPPDKVSVIPNCVDLDTITPRTVSAARQRLGLQERFVVGFSGRIGASQGLESVVDAAALLADDPHLQFLVVGSGSSLATIQARAQRLGLANLRFLPTAPREELADSLAAADLHLVPLRRGLATYSVPSKLLGIMAAGRPALASVDEGSEAARLIARAGCGTVVPPEDPAALAAAIRSYAADTARGHREGAAGRRYLEAELRLETLVDRYEELFTRLIATARGGRR